VAILGSQKTGKSGTLKKLLFYERNKWAWLLVQLKGLFISGCLIWNLKLQLSNLYKNLTTKVWLSIKPKSEGVKINYSIKK
jgi:hypothetical protein